MAAVRPVSNVSVTFALLFDVLPVKLMFVCMARTADEARAEGAPQVECVGCLFHDRGEDLWWEVEHVYLGEVTRMLS